jgi:hypothetical protein
MVQKKLYDFCAALAHDNEQADDRDETRLLDSSPTNIFDQEEWEW